MATRTRKISGSITVGLVLVLLPLLTASVAGQEPAAGSEVAYPPVGLAGQPPPKKETIGDIRPTSDDCRRCHYTYTPAVLTPAGKGMKSNEFIFHNETDTWSTNDIHSAAYLNLGGAIGKQMSERLGYDVTKAAQCLTCHAVDQSPRKPLAEKKFDDFATGEGGINCVACHGMGSKWQGDHTQAPAQVGGPLPWREKDPQYKFDRGMADLRNPAVKAKLCVSCHVGNPDEGKVITHDMYAAGHPPIPPFELAHYMASEPKHWGYPTDEKLVYFKQFAEKNKADESVTWKTFRYFTEDKESYLARHIAAGAVAAMEAEAALLEDAAKTTGSGGFDYARFDCYSCHHDLGYPSARQKRGYEGHPGRVPLKVWNGAIPEGLAKHFVASAGSDFKAWGEAYNDTWPELRKAAVARQLGDPERVKKSAAATRKWCNDYLQLQTTTSKPLFPPAQAKDWLKVVNAAAVSDRWTGDTEAAMALTWASLALRGDLKMPPPKDQLAGLGKVVITHIRPEPFSTPDKGPVPIESKLKDRLNLFAQFRPEEFIARFKKLSE